MIDAKQLTIRDPAQIIADLRYEERRWVNLAPKIRSGNENECERRARLFSDAADLLEKYDREG